MKIIFAPPHCVFGLCKSSPNKTEITHRFYHLIASQPEPGAWIYFRSSHHLPGIRGHFPPYLSTLSQTQAGLDYFELTIYFWPAPRNLNWKILWLILPHRLNTKYAEKISGEKVFWIVKCDAIFLVGMHFCPSSITGPRAESAESGSWKKCIQKTRTRRWHTFSELWSRKRNIKTEKNMLLVPLERYFHKTFDSRSVGVCCNVACSNGPGGLSQAWEGISNFRVVIQTPAQ